jgi:hypothetical protein
MGQWATPIPHSRPSPLTPDDIAANTFPGADRVFQRRLALGRRIARVLQSIVVERDFEIAATFIAALIIQRDRIDQLRRVVRHRAAIGLALFEPGKAIYMSSTLEFAGGVLLTKELCEEHDLDSYAREHYVGQWVKIEQRSKRADLKFSYQNFDSAQQDRFIELYNERKLPLEPMFGLYVKPYFTRVVA